MPLIQWIMQNLQAAPPPPPPSGAAAPQSGGPPWADRDPDGEGFLRELRDAGLLPGIPSLEQEEVLPAKDYLTTSLRVEIRATMLRVEVVERGNLVYITAFFTGDPDEVHLVHLRPGQKRPYADPGFGRPGSKISRVAPGVYIAVIDTTGFDAGMLRWHFWGTGEHQASAFDKGEVVIKDRPAQLL